MALIKEIPRFADPADYENDTSAWRHEQAELLKGRFAEADLPNIIDSMETGLPRNTLPFDWDTQWSSSAIPSGCRNSS